MVVYARCNGPFAQILARARLGGTRMGNESVCASIMASVWQAGQRARQSAELGQWNSPRERREESWLKERERERRKESARWVIPHHDNGYFDSGIKCAPPLFFTPTRRSEAGIHLFPERPSLELSVKKWIEVEKLVWSYASKGSSSISIRVYPVARRRYADFRLRNFASTDPYPPLTVIGFTYWLRKLCISFVRADLRLLIVDP